MSARFGCYSGRVDEAFGRRSKVTSVVARPGHAAAGLRSYPDKSADANSDRGEPAADCQPTNPPASGRLVTSRPDRRNAPEGPPALSPTVLLLFGLLGLGESPPQARAAETVAHDIARVQEKAHQDN